MKRLRLDLAYLGTHFHGWQLQPDCRTVQGCLEKALETVCKQPVRVHGAGRTDSGVHALHQVAHCDIPSARTQVPWQRALNSLLPDDVAVTRAQWVDPDFHARFSATGKIYTYTLWTNPDYVLPQRRAFVWPVGPLDLGLLQAGAGVLTGRHDFTSFQNVGTEVQSGVRNLHRVSIQADGTGNEIRCCFEADGFLKQMVRNLMGTLVKLGRGELDLSALKTILESRDRTQAAATAPPQGLCLKRVTY
jgi:tRNA pseudouridine38-40 synthase